MEEPNEEAGDGTPGASGLASAEEASEQPTPEPDEEAGSEEACGDGSPEAASLADEEAIMQPPESMQAEKANKQVMELEPPATPMLINQLIDDFSLQTQGIRFRTAGREMRIYNQNSGQMILEERGDHVPKSAYLHVQPSFTQSVAPDEKGGRKEGILVRSTKDVGYKFSFLRFTYSLMAVFVGGFLFIMGFAIILFLFIDLSTAIQDDTEEWKVVHFLAALLSVPVFIYSLAMGMTLVGRFVVDTFYGHPFLRSFGWGVATTDWIAFVMYLGIPMLTYIITLFMKLDDWWEISLLVWFACILIFWCFFSFCVLWIEVWACIKLMEEDDGSHLIDDDPWSARMKYWFMRARDGCIRTMRYRLSGTHKNHKKVDERTTLSMSSHVKLGCLKDLRAEGPYSYIANKEWNCCFTPMTPPERIQTLDEIRGQTSYVTKYSWSLQQLFCQTNDSIPITKGESSMTEVQINSNIACNILGNIIIALLLISVLVWFGLPPAVLGIVVVIVAIFMICVGFATFRLFRLRNDIVNQESHTLYRYDEVMQQSTPKDRYILTVVFLEVVFLFLLPLIYLCVANPPIAILFFFLGLFSALRHYMNPRILLLHKKDYFQESDTKPERKEWKQKSLIYHVVGFGGDAARRFWTWLYLLFVVFFAVIVLWASNSSTQTSTSSQEPATLIENYTYPAHPNLPYPTCTLAKGFWGSENTQLQDWAFLARIAYADNERASTLLDTWFGEGVATIDNVTVDEFKNSANYTNFGFNSSAVSYKLITFDDTDSAVVTIRGTVNAWDVIADAQLWLPAMLFQGLRFVLPFSEIFTVILHHMVRIVSGLESDGLLKVAYYRETTAFVKYLQNIGYEVVVTGHSLGGGLAIITGAQSNAPVIALSGVNAKLSRDTFVPPVTVDQLDILTFNIIPENDPVAMIDDKARLYQQINCTAAANNGIDCHTSSRSMCDIQVNCGSANRPVLCECVIDFGYPQPIATTTNQSTSFGQLCVNICKESGGSSEKCARWKETVESNPQEFMA